MIISKTPYRISFFGGGTDYPAWYEVHGGEVLSTAIDCYSYVTCRFLPGFYENKYRVAYRKVESVSAVSEIEHPVVKAALQTLGIEEGLSIHHDGDLPACSGMGSSSTFTVGLLAALYAYKGIYCDPEELANKAIFLEQTLLKECVGIQDQIAAAFGGLNHIRINQDGHYQVSPLVVSSEKRQALESNLLLVFTGQVRIASHVATNQVDNFDRKQSQLRQLQSLVPEALSILGSSSHNIDDFGLLLDEAWKLKRELSSSVTTQTIDEIYTVAKRHGALGGKLLGAGGGGFVLLYVPKDKQQSIKKTLQKYLTMPVTFSDQGASIIYSKQESIATGGAESKQSSYEHAI